MNTRKYISDKPILADAGHHTCDGCGMTWSFAELVGIEDFFLRVSAGGIVPSGECPECGALCYPDDSIQNP